MAMEAHEQLDERTAELVGRMRKHMDERSARALEHLRRAAADELAYRRAAIPAPATALAPEAAVPLPPNTAFLQPVDPRSLATRSVRSTSLPRPGLPPVPSLPWPEICIHFHYPPPYPSGGPLAPITQYSAPPYHESIIGWALAVPADGHLELAAQLFNDDTTATREYGMVYRHLAAHLITAFYQVPPSPKATTLHIRANVETNGSSLVMPRGGVGDTTGFGLVRCDLRMSAFLTTQNSFVSADATPICIMADSFIFESHDLTTAFSIDVPVGAWDLVGIDISAELTLGLSADSNMFISSNFSSLSNWYQAPGQFRVPFVTVGYC